MQIFKLFNRTKFYPISFMSALLLMALGSATATYALISKTKAQSLASRSIWLSLDSQFSMNHQANNPAVQSAIRNYLSDRQNLYHILSASAPYIYYIQTQTQKHHLPAEIALIPAIESEFSPNDYSTVGATGLWQLMPSTARLLGVKVDYDYDGRRDVVASTTAAVRYFSDLGNKFNHNWYLAIAAYNCGDGRVSSAMRYSGSRDFWDLPLPLETRRYVPKLMALAEIIEHPAKYNVVLPKVSNTPYFKEMKVNNYFTLREIAQKKGYELKTLISLNPDYNHGTVPKNGSYSLLVPLNKSTNTIL